jgi:hypothetical protein
MHYLLALSLYSCFACLTIIRKTVIGYAISAAVYLESLLDHISIAVYKQEPLLIVLELISSGSSLEPLSIISSSEAV